MIGEVLVVVVVVFNAVSTTMSSTISRMEDTYYPPYASIFCPKRNNNHNNIETLHNQLGDSTRWCTDQNDTLIRR